MTCRQVIQQTKELNFFFFVVVEQRKDPSFWIFLRCKPAPFITHRKETGYCVWQQGTRTHFDWFLPGLASEGQTHKWRHHQKFLVLNYIEQTNSISPWVSSVVDHKRRQNVTRTFHLVIYSAAPCVPLFSSNHILSSSLIYLTSRFQVAVRLFSNR